VPRRILAGYKGDVAWQQPELAPDHADACYITVDLTAAGVLRVL